MVYTNDRGYRDTSGAFDTLEQAMSLCSKPNKKEIIKLTYNPNKQGNEAYSVEVVHTY